MGIAFGRSPGRDLPPPGELRAESAKRPPGTAAATVRTACETNSSARTRRPTLSPIWN